MPGSVLCVLCEIDKCCYIYIQCAGEETEPREGRDFQKDTQLVSWEARSQPEWSDSRTAFQAIQSGRAWKTQEKAKKRSLGQDRGLGLNSS